MWAVLLSAGICYDTRLKIISPAVKVVEPCTDVSTEGKTNTRQYIYCGFTTLSDAFSGLHSQQLVFHFHLFHYLPVSELHRNSTDYPLFLNDHSWALRIQKPFGWLGPLGLPYITNHIQHWGRSTCKACTYLDEHKSHENELKNRFLCVSVCVCIHT